MKGLCSSLHDNLHKLLYPFNANKAKQVREICNDIDRIQMLVTSFRHVCKNHRKVHSA